LASLGALLGRDLPGRAIPGTTIRNLLLMSDPSLDVVGIGNAIVDVLSQADEAFLATHGLAKGSMTLIDGNRAKGLYAAMGPGIEVSGGFRRELAMRIT
jgi:hypothetical protein